MADLTNVALTTDTMFSGWLNPVEAKDYFEEAEKSSIVQPLATKIPMGPTGSKSPRWTGNVQAAWIGEGDMKPVTKGNFGKYTINPAKIATIFVESAEVVRANPLNYVNTMRTKVAEAIALAFDNAVLNNVNNPFAAGQTNPQALSLSTKKISVASNPFDGINNSLRDLSVEGKKFNGVLLDDSAESIFNGAKDLSGRPLFIDSPTTDYNAPFRTGRILGRPTYLGDHVAGDANVVGYAGDWSKIVWGQVGGINFSVSDQATVNLGTEGAPNMVSLWQHNLVAVMVEAEYAAYIDDVESFVKLSNAAVTHTVALGGATGGTFKLSVGGQETASLAYNATAANVKTALLALPYAAGADVTGSAGGPYTVTGISGVVRVIGTSLTGGTAATSVAV